MESRKYVGMTGGPGGFDGYAGLRIGEYYTGEVTEETIEPTEEGAEPVTVHRVHLMLTNGRPTSISAKEWLDWFKK